MFKFGCLEVCLGG